MPDLPIYNKCNNKCIMCTNPSDYAKKAKGYNLNSLFKRLELFHAGKDTFLNNYRDSFTITGGEPTLSPHLPSVITKINTLFPGIRISLLTNGRMFCYPDYLAKLVSLKANIEFVVPIHGHNDIIHDRVTVVKGSFEQTVKGLKHLVNLRNRNLSVEIRIVIHCLNYKYLPEISSFLAKEFLDVDRVVLIFFEIEGMASSNFRILKLRYNDFRPYINGTIKKLKFFKEFRLYHFPLCVLGKELFPYMWRTLPSSEVSYLECCTKCILIKHCLGIHKGYLKAFGSSEFKPYKKFDKIKISDNWHHPILELKP